MNLLTVNFMNSIANGKTTKTAIVFDSISYFFTSPFSNPFKRYVDVIRTCILNKTTDYDKFYIYNMFISSEKNLGSDANSRLIVWKVEFLTLGVLMT